MSGLAGINVHLVSNTEEAGQFMSWLGERHQGEIAVDTETTGLSPYEDGAALRLVQFGDEMTGWAIPFERWGGVVLEALERYEDPLIFHNIAFEAKWLGVQAGYELPWHRSHDTMIAAHLVDPTGSVALKQLSTRYIDRKAAAGQHLLADAMSVNKWTWATVPIEYEGYWAYACLDTILTSRLHGHLKAHETYAKAYELEMAARRVASQMEDNGAPIDVEYSAQKFQELSDYVERVKAWGQDVLKLKLTSGPQLVKWFRSEGAEVTETTAGGNPSVNKYQLRKWVNDPPNSKVADLAALILDMRKADKLAGTYFYNFGQWHRDGVLHPSIRTLGARTGRMSITQPALQTLPKGEALVRNAFIAREGEVLISSDWWQIEARLMAHFSQDVNMISTFANADASGEDFFTMLGRDLYSDPSMQKDDKRRALVKGTVYGKLYGAGTDKMAFTAGVTVQQMRAVVEAFDTRYPGVKHFQDAVTDAAVRREMSEGQGYVITPIGRRLPTDEGRAYSGTNYLLQSTAADCLKQTMVELDLAGFSDAMILPVHDELIFSVPREDAREAMQKINEIMSITDKFDVNVPADPEGPLERWGAKYGKSNETYRDPHEELYTA